MSRAYPWSLDDLRPGDRQVIALVAKGLDDGEIGERLCMNANTVGRALTRICDAWGVYAGHRRVARVQLTLRFLLVEGHLERVDWPVPGLEERSGR